MAMTIEVKFRELTKLDRCDRCSAAAKVLIKTKKGGELTMCAHHGNEHQYMLEARGCKMKWSD